VPATDMHDEERIAPDASPAALRLDGPDPEIEAGLALLEIAPRLTRLENTVLGELDPPLTFRQYRFLERVSQGHTTITALGRLATITLPAVSESVDVLVRRGLLARSPSERDRRESHLTVTAAGSSALIAAREVLDELAATLLTGVSARRHATLARDARAVGVRVTEELNAFRDRSSE
jgi:DNA-binding MarR family transcriptional regulator